MPDIFVSKKPNAPLPKSVSKKKRKKAKKKKKDGVNSYMKRFKSYPFNPLSSFIYHPRNANFLNKDPEEKVILVLRKHQITNVSWILTGIVMLLAPAVLKYFPLLEFFPERFKFIAIIIWYLITTAFVFEKFLTWYFNVNIITDERVFDVDFVHLTYREITDANIDQIQDVTVKMGSVIRTISNYGDIVIQTAAEIPQISFEAVPRPDEIAKILRELRIEEEQEKIEGRVR